MGTQNQMEERIEKHPERPFLVLEISSSLPDHMFFPFGLFSRLVIEEMLAYPD